MPAAEMHMFICVPFSPHTNSSGQKIKKCIHYIYAKYPFFIFKKCIHYIYTRNDISSRQQSFHRPHHYSSIPKTSRQQAKTDQTTTLPPHILRAAELSIQRSKAKPQRDHNNTAKRYALTPPQAYTYFFAHFSRFLQNGRHGAYIRP